MSNVYIRYSYNDSVISTTGGCGSDLAKDFFQMRDYFLKGNFGDWIISGNEKDVYLIELVRKRKSGTKKIIDKFKITATGKFIDV